MAVDKLVDSTQLDSDLTSVANAIRAKSGGSSQLAFPAGFVSEIGNIPSGGSGLTLLASGSYTQVSGNDLTIPCTYTGTPRIIVVEVDTPLTATAQAISAGKYLTTASDPAPVQSAVPTGMGYGIGRKADESSQNVAWGSTDQVIVSASNFKFSRLNGTYTWKPNTYNWYIYG